MLAAQPFFDLIRRLITERLFPDKMIDIQGDGNADFVLPGGPYAYYIKNLFGPVFLVAVLQFLFAFGFTQAPHPPPATARRPAPAAHLFCTRDACVTLTQRVLAPSLGLTAGADAPPRPKRGRSRSGRASARHAYVRTYHPRPHRMPRPPRSRPARQLCDSLTVGPARSARRRLLSFV